MLTAKLKIITITLALSSGLLAACSAAPGATGRQDDQAVLSMHSAASQTQSWIEQARATCRQRGYGEANPQFGNCVRVVSEDLAMRDLPSLRAN